MLLYTTMVGSFVSGTSTHYKSEQLTGWMQREGNTVHCTVCCKDMSANCKVTLDVLHKNNEDTGEGSTTGSVESSSGIGDQDLVLTVSNLKELVRMEVTCETSDESGDNSVHCLVQPLAPQWQWSGA